MSGAIENNLYSFSYQGSPVTFSLGEKLGAGGFGSVYELELDSKDSLPKSFDSSNFVVKVHAKRQQGASENFQEYQRALERQSARLSNEEKFHQKYNGFAFSDEKQGITVQSKVSGKSLSSPSVKSKFLSKDFSLRDRLVLLRDLASQYNLFAHYTPATGEPIIHLDTHPSNIVVNIEAGTVKSAAAIDYGLSEGLSDEEQRVNKKRFTGAKGTHSPEMYDQLSSESFGVGVKADIYALAVVAARVLGVNQPTCNLSGSQPYGDLNIEGMLDFEFPQDEGFPAEQLKRYLRSFVLRMRCEDEAKRASADEFLAFTTAALNFCRLFEEGLAIGSNGEPTCEMLGYQAKLALLAGGLWEAELGQTLPVANLSSKAGSATPDVLIAKRVRHLDFFNTESRDFCRAVVELEEKSSLTPRVPRVLERIFSDEDLGHFSSKKDAVLNALTFKDYISTEGKHRAIIAACLSSFNQFAKKTSADRIAFYALYHHVLRSSGQKQAVYLAELSLAASGLWGRDNFKYFKGSSGTSEVYQLPSLEPGSFLVREISSLMVDRELDERSLAALLRFQVMVGGPKAGAQDFESASLLDSELFKLSNGLYQLRELNWLAKSDPALLRNSLECLSAKERYQILESVKSAQQNRQGAKVHNDLKAVLGELVSQDFSHAYKKSCWFSFFGNRISRSEMGIKVFSGQVSVDDILKYDETHHGSSKAGERAIRMVKYGPGL